MIEQHDDDDPVAEPVDAGTDAPQHEVAGAGVHDVPDAPDEHADEHADESPEDPAATGHPAVDEVLRSLQALEGRPVDEHVAAFEDAHEQLRRALSGAGDDTP